MESGRGDRSLQARLHGTDDRYHHLGYRDHEACGYDDRSHAHPAMGMCCFIASRQTVQHIRPLHTDDGCGDGQHRKSLVADGPDLRGSESVCRTERDRADEPSPGATRGERRIYFEHLPSLCTIRIFTINGDLVQTLVHDVGMQNAREYWNLLNRDGFSVAYGVYIAHIDAPGVGEKILKFALIK